VLRTVAFPARISRRNRRDRLPLHPDLRTVWRTRVHGPPLWHNGYLSVSGGLLAPKPPPDPEDVEQELRVAKERLGPRPAVLDLQDGKPKILSEEGVTELEITPNSGGWGQHGYDASQDEDEKRGR
jgi:hypothetical protein